MGRLLEVLFAHRGQPHEYKRFSAVQVFVRPWLAVPLQLHRGSLHEAVSLRAVPTFGAGKREAYSFVDIRSANILTLICPPLVSISAKGMALVYWL